MTDSTPIEPMTTHTVIVITHVGEIETEGYDDTDAMHEFAARLDAMHELNLVEHTSDDAAALRELAADLRTAAIQVDDGSTSGTTEHFTYTLLTVSGCSRNAKQALSEARRDDALSAFRAAYKTDPTSDKACNAMLVLLAADKAYSATQLDSTAQDIAAVWAQRQVLAAVAEGIAPN
jgi:hypothetical protein